MVLKFVSCCRPEEEDRQCGVILLTGLSYPRAVALGTHVTLYIADPGNTRIVSVENLDEQRNPKSSLGIQLANGDACLKTIGIRSLGVPTAVRG